MGMFKSDLSWEEFPESQKVRANEIRSGIFQKIKETNPHFEETCCLSQTELTEYRNRYISSTLEHEVWWAKIGKKRKIGSAHATIIKSIWKQSFEIRMLHERMDHLILNQQQRLFEIQQIQLGMLKEIKERVDQNK